MEAASRGIAANVHLLLDRGVDVNARDDEGHTAIDHATWCSNTCVVQILEQHISESNEILPEMVE